VPFIDSHSSRITKNYLLLHPGRDLQDQWGPDLRRSVRRGQLRLTWPSSCLLGVPFGSREFLALRWTAPAMILRDVASRCGFTW
jgi:hypothetical protein